MNPAVRLVLRTPVLLYRVGLGTLLGGRFLLLEHTGRRSGRPRRTVLEVAGVDSSGAPLVVAGFGERSDWVRNVTETPAVAVTWRRRRRNARAVRLDREATVALLVDYRGAHPRAASALGRAIGVDVTDPEKAASALPAFRFRASWTDHGGDSTPSTNA